MNFSKKGAVPPTRATSDQQCQKRGKQTSPIPVRVRGISLLEDKGVLDAKGFYEA